MLSWVAIVLAFVLIVRYRNRVEALETKAEALSKELAHLRGLLSTVGTQRAPANPPVAVPPAPVFSTAPAARPTAPVAARTAEASSSPADRIFVPPPPGAPPPPPPPRLPRPAVPPTPPIPPKPEFDWEKVIGVRLFSWIAGAALALGAIFFLAYSVQQGWLRPEIRMGFGLVTGLGLLVACELKAARRYAVTANALDASGIAILFATVYASFALWHLVPAAISFGLLMLVAGIAVLLSIRRDSMFIAVLGMLGGFATPVLLSSGQDNPIGLFGYLLLLNAGLAWVAYRKRWPSLTALSMAFTTLYQWGWIARFLTPGRLPLAVGIFLIFPILSLVAFGLGHKHVEPAENDESVLDSPTLFASATRASAALPLLFALYLAAVPAYGVHFGILFGFLFALTAGLFALAITTGPDSLHFLGALSTVGVFAIWLNTAYSNAGWPWMLGFVAAFVALFLTAPVVARRMRAVTLTGLGARAVFAGPLLLFVFPLLFAMEPGAAAPALPFATLFVLMAGCAAYAIVEREGAVHFVAAFFAMAGEAVWSARYLDPASLYAALALYGAFGLFYVGAPVLARRLGRPLAPSGAAGVLTLVSLALLLFLAMGSVAASALWGMALLIAVLNVGLFSEASHARLPLISIVGAVLSWVVIGVWWVTAAAASMILPALIVMGGFAVLTLAGNTWAAARADADNGTAAQFTSGTFVGLIGHVFIAFIVTRPELSIPPWPIFGVLGGLQIAMLGASLFLRRGALHLAASAATAVILLLWTFTARVSPWPQVAILAAAAPVLIALAGLPLARRLAAPSYEFELAVAVAALLGQAVTIGAQMQTGAPVEVVLVVAQLAFVVGTLALSWVDIEHVAWASVAAVVPAMLAAALWQSTHNRPGDWISHIVFAAPLYLLFTAHPLLLGRRVRDARSPFAAAVLAAVAFFFLARHAMMIAGFGGYIGALPLIEAALLAPVLGLLVYLERGKQRMATDRLVLVAAALLALVTVAIPLQLEKNWITIAWALEGAALLWLCRRLPHAGLLAAATALLATVFVRLALNPAVLSYHSRGAMPILNWYLYTYLVCAVAMFAAARLARPGDGHNADTSRLIAAFSAAGAVLLFLLLNIEIADFYSTGATITFNFGASLAQDLTYTLGWAGFALAVLAAGIVMRNKPTRVASIILLVVTVFKCFVHDLGRLGGLYRVGSFVGLAICLALVALTLQKFVLSRGDTSVGEAQPGEARA